MTNPNLKALRRAGTLRRRAERLLAESDEILAAHVPQAVESGMPLTEIAQLGHVSRPKLYRMLRRDH